MFTVTLHCSVVVISNIMFLDYKSRCPAGSCFNCDWLQQSYVLALYTDIIACLLPRLQNLYANRNGKQRRRIVEQNDILKDRGELH